MSANTLVPLLFLPRGIILRPRNVPVLRACEPVNTFDQTGLCPQLLHAAKEQGWQTPTAIQEWAIPVILGGEDCWAEAPTGSGKTAAFALPLLQQLMHHPTPRRRHASCLVLAPTRELAVQTASLFRVLSRGICTGSGDAVRVVTLHGGVALNPQLQALNGGADILVATPGRLLDLLVSDGVRLEQVCMGMGMHMHLE